MVGEIVSECLHRRTQEHDRSVGVFARAATMHLAGPALQPLQVAGIGAPLGDPGAGVGQSPQAEEARSTLGRALAREVAHDAGALANRALPAGPPPYHAPSNRQP